MKFRLERRTISTKDTEWNAQCLRCGRKIYDTMQQKAIANFVGDKCINVLCWDCAGLMGEDIMNYTRRVLQQ